MQLIRAMVAVAALATIVHADTEFASKVQVYADSDHTSVISPLVEAKADVGATTNVSLGYVVDAVSSASVDVVSQASPITFHDTRHQVAGGISQGLGTWTVRGGYSFSRENDYLSHSLDTSIQDELFDKNTTLALGYGISFNDVGRRDDDNFHRALTVQRVAASWTQVLSQRFIAQVTYELTHAAGYQASPYRFVPVRMTADAAPDFWVPETDPDLRWRHAVVIGANHAVGTDDAVQADYRIYRDTWGITSHTIGARYFTHLAKRVELRLRERFYVQNGATFYQSRYTEAAKYMTFDRELSPLWSETLGGKLTVGFSEHLEGELKLDAFYYHYADFVPLASRTGANVGVGLSLTY